MKKLINLRPVLFIAVSLSCGITTAYFFMSNKSVWGVLILCAFILAITLYILHARRKIKATLIYALIFICFFGFGYLRLNSTLNSFDKANLNNHYYEVTGKVTKSIQTNYGLKLTLKNVRVKGNVSGELKYGVLTYVYGNSEVNVGDKIQFSSYLIDKSYVYEGKFNMVDVENGIRYTSEISDKDLIIVSNNLNIFERSAKFIKSTLYNGLEGNSFSVGYALLTGNSELIDQDVLGGYRTAGVAHVFAVSGLHIGFLAVALTFVFNKIKIKPWLSSILTIIVIVFYSGICGFSASAVRATVMTSVMLFASTFGKRYDGLSAISLAALGILTVSPTQLLCVGFQLSFAVVIGINLLAKPIASFLKFLPNKISISIGTVIAAQLSSMPIMISTFGEFSLISVVVNLLFIPIVSVIFILLLLFTFIGGVFGIESILLYPLNIIFKLVNMLISAFDSNFFMVGGIILGGAILSYYATLIVASGLINLRKSVRILTAFALAITCLVTSIIYTVRDNNAVKIYVSGTDSFCATLINEKSETVLVVNYAEYFFSTSRLMRIKNLTGKKDIDFLVITGGFSVDKQVLVSKINSVFIIKNVVYYGSRDLTSESIIKKSFPSIQISNVLINERLPLKIFESDFVLGGTALIGDIRGKKTALISPLNKAEENLNNLKGEYDIVISAGRSETVLSRFNAPISVSYLDSSVYPDAETDGNMLIKLT